MVSFLAATVNIISNKFKDKKVKLDKHYLIKSTILFLLSVVVLYLLEKS